MPDLVQFRQEMFIIGHVAKLAGNVRVLFESPIGRRRHHKMDTIIFDCGCVSSVAMQY